ncbi:hypothetical protein [Variovorax sp. JS1663]|uniref:hypothetical protein n=1 Tax=Variovorax sp. JS1663 TaxID=1851577 RepID=UPI00117DFA0E|nr:hypothetical protein [Variovorax sp. JS1663]
MRDHETNTGWWTEKPDRQDRPSSYASLGNGGTRRRRSEPVWTRAALIVALMVTLGWAVLRLARL